VRAAALLAALALAGCAGSQDGVDGADRDVRAVVAHLEEVHPDPFHDLAAGELRAAADELAARAEDLEPDELLVELMRLSALPGPRDGHGGIYPLDPAHARPLHLYPLRLYRFPEGFHVVGEVGRRGLVGARVVAIDGEPVEEVAARLRPLVPADNAWSARARVAQWLVVAEVLHGAGVAATSERATFEVELDGSRREVELEPVPAERWAAAFPDLFVQHVPQGLPRRPAPPYLARRTEPSWAALLADGRVAYAALNVTLGDTFALSERLLELAARPAVERVVLDLRHNPGGDVSTYAPLLDALRSPAIDRPGRLFVLVSRATFSAAQVLCSELERTTDAVFVGEPTGGSPNLYGDPSSRRLPVTGWNVHAATVYWEGSEPGDARLTLEPDLRVPLTAADFFAGRDPVLERALP
jgi:C-terminal processing protease CtpA/Prc/outer membrane murein-binding lipoprotein Lpp